MARSKLKNKKKSQKLPSVEELQENEDKVPIPKLPEKFLWMKVKSGTKIKNVLEYSLKEFSGHKSIVWSGAGQSIGKVISCAEIFKRKLSGLHQITKIRYIQAKNREKAEGNGNLGINRLVPEIHILLSRDVLDTKEPGYQAPGICSMFQDSGVHETNEKSQDQNDQSSKITKMSNVTAEEFAAMGLRTGQKRPRKDQQTEMATKKNRKKGNCGDK